MTQAAPIRIGIGGWTYPAGLPHKRALEHADVTGDFVYARLENAVEDVATGYDDAALDRWAKAARTWAGGGVPDGLPCVDPRPPRHTPRETFVFFINGAKVRAPAGALALIDRLAQATA